LFDGSNFSLLSKLHVRNLKLRQIKLDTMNSKNNYFGGDGQSDNDIVVAYPVNSSNFIADTGLQPSLLRFQNEGAIFI
jgi:hypothetical protein